MDLMRAVIIGAYGTPYQDGIYFFDFHLPPDYPNVPPVRYVFIFNKVNFLTYTL